MTTREITAVEERTVARAMAVVGILVLDLGMIAWVVVSASGHYGMEHLLATAGVILIAGAVAGAVFGYLLGLVYNIAAEFFGGIVVQID